jgi:hypothetical protein
MDITDVSLYIHLVILIDKLCFLPKDIDIMKNKFIICNAKNSVQQMAYFNTNNPNVLTGIIYIIQFFFSFQFLRHEEFDEGCKATCNGFVHS